MDRRSIIGIVLIAGVVLTWAIFFSGNKNETPPKALNTDSVAAAQKAALPPDTATAVAPAPKVTLPDSSLATLVDSTGKPVSDSAAMVLDKAKKAADFGEYAPVMSGTSDTIHVVTDLLDIKIPTRGASIQELRLQKYYMYDSVGKQPIVMPDGYNVFNLVFNYTKSSTGIINSSDIYFKPNTQGREVVVKGDEVKNLTFRADLGAGRFIDIIYTFKGNSYDFGYDVALGKMGDLAGRNQVDLVWKAIVPKTEKAMKLMRDKTALYYRNNAEVDNLAARKSDRQEEIVQGAIDWISFRSQFFAHTLIAGDKEAWNNATVAMVDPMPTILGDDESGDVVKLMEATVPIPIKGGDVETHHFRMFTGPLDYHTLKSYDLKLERQIVLGWGPLKYINQWMIIPIFNWLERFIGNYAIIILLLAIFIKLITYPFTYKTFISSAKMRVINQTPQMKALDEKHKDNPTKLQQEKMAVYRSMGANPLGGCLPALLSYPFLMALFFFFPNALELRQQRLFWAEDLSTYDSIASIPDIPFYGDHISLFTILMTVSIFLFTIVNQKQQPAMANNPAMKYLPYIMPIIFLGVLNNYSAGLSYYYFLSQILSIGQTQLTKLFIDDKKVLAQLEVAQKKKGAKPGGGKGWLERKMEQAQKRQREMTKQAQQGKKK